MLAIDPGERRIGVAVSDSSRTLAFPRPAIDAGENAVQQLGQLVDEEMVRAVVVGLPLGLDGREGTSAKAARRLGASLQEHLGENVPVTFHDERLTTVQAARTLHHAGHASKEQRAVIDSASATVLLEAWLLGR